MHVIFAFPKSKWNCFINTIFPCARWMISGLNFDSLILCFPLLESLGSPWKREIQKDKKSQFWKRWENITRQKEWIKVPLPMGVWWPSQDLSADVSILPLNCSAAGSGHTLKTQQFSGHGTFSIFSKRKVWIFEDIFPTSWLHVWSIWASLMFLLLLPHPHLLHQNRPIPASLGKLRLHLTDLSKGREAQSFPHYHASNSNPHSGVI